MEGKLFFKSLKEIKNKKEFFLKTKKELSGENIFYINGEGLFERIKKSLICFILVG